MSAITQRTFLKRTSQGLAGLAVAPTALAKPLGQTERSTKPVATFSIVGFDPRTGDLGVAVQSKFFAVGSVVSWAQAGVGAIAGAAHIESALCQGCGLCVAACPAGAIDLRHFTDSQIMAKVDAMFGPTGPQPQPQPEPVG